MHVRWIYILAACDFAFPVINQTYFYETNYERVSYHTKESHNKNFVAIFFA